MIFITTQNTIVNISKTQYHRDTLFYQAVHTALFNKSLSLPNFTTTISKQINLLSPS